MIDRSTIETALQNDLASMTWRRASPHDEKFVRDSVELLNDEFGRALLEEMPHLFIMPPSDGKGFVGEGFGYVGYAIAGQRKMWRTSSWCPPYDAFVAMTPDELAADNQ